MSCQSTKCLICKNKFKACQLIKGVCVSCISKQEKENNNAKPTIKR